MLQETYFSLFKKRSKEIRTKFKDSSYIYIIKQKEPKMDIQSLVKHSLICTTCVGEIDKTKVLNYYKIGYGKSTRKRLSSIQMCNPYEIELIFTYETLFANEIEKNIHLYYNSRKVRGEWFLISEDEIQNFMRHDFFHTIIEQSPVLIEGKNKPPSKSIGTVITILPDGFDSEHIFFTPEGVNTLNHFEFIELTTGGIGNVFGTKRIWGQRMTGDGGFVPVKVR